MRKIMKTRKKNKIKFNNIYCKENGSGFRYRFKAKGKEYSGICLKCKTEEQAYQYMQKIKMKYATEKKG